MSRRSKMIYRCPVCDTVVEVLDQWGLDLVCCGRAMMPLRAKAGHHGHEQHAVLVERQDAGVRVQVGDPLHPMEQGHFVQWIELVADGHSCRAFLEPGGPAEACFDVRADRLAARAYCNRHGLWRSAEEFIARPLGIVAAARLAMA